MRIDRALWLFLITGGVFGVTIALYWLFHTDTDADFYSAIVWSIVLALPYAWLVKSLGSIVRHLLWKADGWPGMPIFIYPILISCADRYELVLNFDPIGFFAIITPPGYKAFDDGDVVTAQRVIYDRERKTLIFEILICAVIAAIAIFLDIYDCFFSVILLIAILFIIYCTRDNTYHGQIMKISAINSGFVSHYTANAAIINGEDSSYIIGAWRHWMKSSLAYVGNMAAFELLDLISLKYLLLIACAKKELLPPKIMDYIESTIIKPLKLGRLFFNREAIEVTKLFMYYGLIHSELDKSTISVNKFIELMRDRDMPIGDGLSSYFDWYISIGLSKRFYERNDRGKKMKLLSKDYPYCKFRSYKALMNDLETQIMNVCQLLPR
jgi:hypothetical protein